MARARVGIKQVAAAAGVSPTTVSHALNGKGRLPDETRERIQAIALEMGYKPSAIARNLVQGRTQLLGLVMPPATELIYPAGDVAYFVQLTSAATSVAMQSGYALVVATAPDDGTPAFEMVDVDGAIVVDPVERDPQVRALREAGTPVVTTGRVLGEESASPWLDNDHVEGTRLVLDHLERQGARRPAIITSQPDTSYARDVEEAYDAWCAARGIEPLLVRSHAELSEDAAAAAARETLDLVPGCDAVFATLDRLALATLREARLRGVAVPGDLLVVGATDSESARWADPSLTVLNMQPDLIGRRAAELLLELVDGTDEEARAAAAPQPPIPLKLITRASTRKSGRAGSGRSRQRSARS